MSTRILTQALAHECFNYSPETGVLRWKVRPREHFASDRGWRASNTRFAGKEAGSTRPDGYRRLKVFGSEYLAHRLAWLMMTGELPKEIDHISGDPSDNRLCNLRNVDSQMNSRNAAISERNTSGYVGVHLNRRDRKWQASISTGKRHIYLGQFTDKSEAIAARKAAEIEFGYHQNHGRQKPIPVRD